MTTLVSSASLLGSSLAAYRPTFSPNFTNNTRVFDEGRRIINESTETLISSGAMVTTAIDAYAQGVEITRQGQYDAGLAKIWSGDRNHELVTNRFGMDKSLFVDPGFADIDYFNPVVYLEAQVSGSPLVDQIFTYPIITSDNDQRDNTNLDGIIEPLTIRAVASFFSIDVPRDAHTVRGSFGGGNIDQRDGSEQILTIDYFLLDDNIAYLDMVDIIDGHPLNGYFRYEFTTLQPFIDIRYVRNTTLSDDEFTSALNVMTGSTDNYVRHNQRSATCGWYYDNTISVGTDSLAYGGMTH